MREFVTLCLSMALLSVTTTASAEAAAEALFRAGREALKRGSLEEACARFEESYRLESAVGTLLNLALCEERRGRIVRAWELFSRAASDLPPADARVELARKHLAHLSQRVPTVVLRTDSASARLEFSLDGLRLGAASLGVPLPVDPGRHVVEVRMGSEVLERREFEVVESGKYVLDLAPGERLRRPERRPNVERAVPAPSSDHTKGIIALGAASSLFVVGGLAGLAAIRAKHVVGDECDARMACSSAGVDAASRGKGMSIVSTGAFALGAGVLGAGLWLLLKHDVEPTHAHGVGTSVRLGAGADGLTLAF